MGRCRIQELSTQCCRHLMESEAKAAPRSHQRPALVKCESLIQQTSQHPRHPHPKSPTVTMKEKLCP